jgi:hypothetical protein
MAAPGGAGFNDTKQPSPLEDPVPSIPACLRDNAPRWCGGLSRYAADSRESHLGSVITAHPVHAAPRRS